MSEYNLYFHDSALLTINDLTNLSHNVISEKFVGISRLFERMKNLEIFLYQQSSYNSSKYSKSIFFSSKRFYSFSDMVSVQEHMEVFVLLESLKYSPYYVNARQLLQNYLYSGYKYSISNLLEDKKPRKQEMISTNANILYGKEQLSLPIREVPAKVIRKHLNTFLSDRIYSANNKYGLSLKRCDSSNDSEKSKHRYYLPVYSIPEFLLLFTYFDGRDFSHIENSLDKKELKYLPRNAQKGHTEISYKIVLKKIQDSYPSKPTCGSHSLSTIYQYDKLFLFRKLNILSFYQKLYLSEPILNKIIQKYRLTYSEIEGLKSFLIDNIFKDVKFISRGLKSACLDFMLPFDIFFQSSLLFGHRDLINSPSLDLFKNDLARIKLEALMIFENTFLYEYAYKTPTLLFEENGNFSITKNQSNIRGYLENNKFFIKYYFSEDKFISNYISPSKNSQFYYPDFKTLKNIIDLNI